MIKMLRIKLDSHYHGSSDVPRPWVARVDGPDPIYEVSRLRRTVTQQEALSWLARAS